MRLPSVHLRALADRMVDGANQRDVDALLQRAMKDGTLHPEELSVLRSVAESATLEDDARQALRTFLSIRSPSLQAMAAAGSGDLDVKGLAPYLTRVLANGKVSHDEKVALSVVESRRSLTTGAAQVLGVIRHGGQISDGELSLLERLERNELSVGDLPAPALAKRDFALATVAICPSALSLLPPQLTGDLTFLAAAVQANPEVARSCPMDSAAVLRAILPFAPRAILWAHADLYADRGLLKLAISHDPSVLGRLAQFHGDRELALLAFAHGADHTVFESLSDRLRADKDVAMAAVAVSGEALRFAGRTLRGDRDVVTAAIRNNGNVLSWASPQLREDRDLVLMAIGTGKHLYPDLSPALRKDKDVLLAAAGHGTLREVPAAVWADTALITKLLEQSPVLFASGSERARANRTLLQAAMVTRPEMFLAAAPPLCDDKALALSFITSSAWQANLAALSGRLRDDPDVILAAARRGAIDLALLSDRLQRDVDFVTKLLALSTQRGCTTVPAPLMADRSFVTRVLPHQPRLLGHAPAAFRADRDLVRLAAWHAPLAFADAADELRADRPFALEMVRRCGALFPFLHDTLRADRELLELALQTDYDAFQYAAPALRDDRELVCAAMKRNPNVLACASDRLRADKALALQMVERDGTAWTNLHTSIRDDVDVALAAAGSWPPVLEMLPQTLRSHPGFLKRLAERNLLAFDAIPVEREVFFATQPKIRNEYRRLKASLFALGIECSERLGSTTLARELIANRTQPRRPDDTRPLAVWVGPKEDWNGAFGYESLEGCAATHRLLCYEAGSNVEVAEALADAGKHREQASLIVLGAHGEPTIMAFGEDDPAHHPVNADDNSAYLRVGDDVVRAPLSGLAAPDAHVVIKSCSTGAARDAGDNMARFIAGIVPQAHVYAPTTPTNNRIVFDAAGKFSSPGYVGGEGVTFHIPPTASPPSVPSVGE